MQLYERDRQQQLLEEALTAAVAGEGRLALISGEAGIGKTSLAEQFTAHHRKDCTLYWGACDNWFTPRPLGPFSDIAFQMHSDLLDLIQSGSNWRRAATAFFRRLTEIPTPVILVVEDIHWADEATLDMLKFLSRRIQHSRILLILTFRDDETASRLRLTHLTGSLPPRLTLRISLPPLSPGSVQQMARQARRQDEDLYTLTGGNPFFVTEMLASEPDVIPASVRDLALSRLARVSPPARQVAEFAALVPGGVELWLLERAFPNANQAMEECVERGLLHGSPNMLSFRHELARQAVADALTPPAARRYHAQILLALLEQHPEDPPLARIIHHAAHAGDFAVLLRYAPAAARQASRLGAHREAAAHYRIVLNQVTSMPPETRAALLEGLSVESYLTGEIGPAIQVRQQAAAIWKRLEQPLRQGDNLRWLSRLSWFSGKRQEAEQYAQAAVAMLEKLPPGPELAMAYSNKSQLHMLSEENEPARFWGEKAIELAARLDAPEILMHALTNVGTAEIQIGDEHGWGLVAQGLSIAHQKELHDDAGRAYANLVSNCIHARRYAEAGAWLDEGLAYTEEYELDSYRVYLLGWQATLHFQTGQWPLAEAAARQALDLHTGASVLPIPAVTALAHLKARRGDADAETWLERADGLSAPTRELQRIGPVAAACAEAAWWRGEPHRVAAAAQPGVALALTRHDRWILGELAYWQWRAGQQDLPLERMAAPYRLMIAGQWQAAAEAWRSLGCPFEQALALSEGDHNAQMEALTIFEQLAARPALEMLKNKLRRQGVKGIPRGPRPTTRQNPAGLTRRELEVLALLAEGLSNAEIAGRLSISRKTAGHHISALLGKLHAATRSQAVAVARKQNLLP